MFEPVLDLPEPAHVVMTQHDALGVGGRTTGVEQVAALAWSLFEHEFDNDPVVDVRAEVQELSPVVDLDAAVLEVGRAAIALELFPILRVDDGVLHTELEKLCLMRKVLLLECVPCVRN